MGTENEDKDKPAADDPSRLPGVHGTIIGGAPSGFTRVKMTLTAEQVEALKARGYVLRRISDEGEA